MNWFDKLLNNPVFMILGGVLIVASIIWILQSALTGPYYATPF